MVIRFRRSAAFTLIELLVVIAILAVLAGLLLDLERGDDGDESNEPLLIEARRAIEEIHSAAAYLPYLPAEPESVDLRSELARLAGLLLDETLAQKPEGG